MSEGTSQPDLRRVPVIAYDDSCAFCSHWAERIRSAADGRAVCLSAHQAAAFAPGTPRADFARALVLIQPDGTVCHGASAVLRILATVRGRRWPVWLYDHIPGFARLSEYCYRLIARHRGQLPPL